MRPASVLVVATVMAVMSPSSRVRFPFSKHSATYAYSISVFDKTSETPKPKTVLITQEDIAQAEPLIIRLKYVSDQFKLEFVIL
jgi:hypothetical protein